jgi:hypothetical protein
MLAFMLFWLFSQLKTAKDGRFYVVQDGNIKYLPKGVVLDDPELRYWNSLSEAAAACLQWCFKDPSFHNDDPTDFINPSDVAKMVHEILSFGAGDYRSLMNDKERAEYNKLFQDKETNMKKFTIVGTGSRSLVTDETKFEKVLAYLTELLAKAKAKHGENLLVISGMAEGFDEALAKAAMANNITLLAAIPNRGYSNYYWRDHSMTALNRFADFQELVKYADQTGGVVYTCGCIKNQPAKCGHWDGRIYNFQRNSWMVDQADIVWVYDPSSKGTAHAYNDARKKGVRTHIINLESLA